MPGTPNGLTRRRACVAHSDRSRDLRDPFPAGPDYLLLPPYWRWELARPPPAKAPRYPEVPIQVSSTSMDWAWTRRTGCCIRQRITGCSGCPNKADPVRVADRYQDTMGFTVNGPNTFLGSGHPDFVADPDFPTRLGLIRSDGGKGGRSCHSAGLPTSTPCTQPTAWCTDGILEPAGSWSPPTTGPVGTSAALWTCSTSRSARPTPTFCWPPPRHRESCAASMVGARGNRLVTLVARQAPGRQNRANVEATVRGYAGFPAAEW